MIGNITRFLFNMNEEFVSVKFYEIRHFVHHFNDRNSSDRGRTVLLTMEIRINVKLFF